MIEIDLILFNTQRKGQRRVKQRDGITLTFISTKHLLGIFFYFEHSLGASGFKLVLKNHYIILLISQVLISFHSQVY